MIVTPRIAAFDLERDNDHTLDILLSNLRAERDGKAFPNRIDPAKGS